MSERRATTVGTQIEYVAIADERRATTVGTQIEYVAIADERRATLIGVQVEYADHVVILPQSGFVTLKPSLMPHHTLNVSL